MTTQVSSEKKKFGFAISWAVLMFGLPPLVYYFWICLHDYGGAMVVPHSWAEFMAFVHRVPGPSLTAVAAYLGWFGLQAFLQVFAPGTWHEGTPLADGRRLPYKMNGWFSFWFSLGVVFFAVWRGWIKATFIADNFGQLLTTAHIFAFVFSVFLYVHGKRTGPSETVTGAPIYDYFMGTGLNPRVGTFDFKFFCESRPGLIGWILVNLSLAAKQHELHGTLTTAMVLVNAFHFLYIADYFYHEEAILTTWDIKHENFGWMLCWGDLVWVPFTYTFQAYYLVNHLHTLSVLEVFAIVALNMLGYMTFRGSNIQKHRFRKDPTGLVWGRKPDFIQTEKGSLLLTSGWWGIARHTNYLGDLMMALAWCLPCLFGNLLPYFYIIYFFILLVHRERRDNETCAEKYGKDWDEYCARVPWRIFPGIY